MPKRIHERARPIAIELVFERLLHSRARSNSTLKHCVNVFDVNHQTHGRAADCLAREAHLGMFVRKHNDRVANLDFGVTNCSARRGNAKQLNCANAFW